MTRLTIHNMEKLKARLDDQNFANRHPSITAERAAEAIERSMVVLGDPGFCLDCGEEQGGCEPDARGHKCESCGERAVYGAEEILIRLAP